MPIISDKDKEILKKSFSDNLSNTVKLVVFTQKTDCHFCKETRESKN
ncbi:MAG: hypothetical protein ACE5J9_01495 [Methanosarcinales archaeon]